MSKTAVFGGTFNPVHNGHIRLLRLVKEQLNFDRIIVMPAKVPPHKAAEGLAAEEHRLKMLELAFADMGNAEISDYEMKNEGKSYSVITLRHLHELYPDDRLYFIMGSDMLLYFDKWYCYKEILSLASLVCISRCSSDTEKLEPCAENLRQQGGDVIVLEDEPFELSSTQLRDMIKRKDLSGLSNLLPESVAEYIIENNLYN